MKNYAGNSGESLKLAHQTCNLTGTVQGHPPTQVHLAELCPPTTLGQVP